MPTNTSTHRAIINLGGKQYLVAEGEKILVNRLANKEGDTVKTTDLLSNKEVSLKVESHELGEKIHGLKFKNKVRYTRRYGHRQQLTALTVQSIGGQTEKPKTTEKAVKSAVKATSSAHKRKTSAKKVTNG